MKEFVFLANDPGGYDCVYPVTEAFRNLEGVSVQVFFTGPAGEKAPQYRSEKEAILALLREKIAQGQAFILVTGTSWNCDTETSAIGLCKASGVKTVSILDYWSNYKRRFVLGEGYIFPDAFFVMDELAKEEAEADGIPAGICRITGNPGLDRYAGKASAPKTVLFLSQPLSVINLTSDGYTEVEAFDGVCRACEQLGLIPRIKFHPKEAPWMLEKYRHLEAAGTMDEAVAESDVIVGMTTMGLLQCAMSGIPVISYQPGLSVPDKCITNKLGITRGAFTYEDLVAQLQAITGAMDPKALPFWFDGASTKRCVDELLKMAEE
ncbi:MAG: hypothetical protein IKS07_05635 [Lachnospiraceae bacterium]|nr:hypothetical protein [Lachnospiraceae bacterium]